MNSNLLTQIWRTSCFFLLLLGLSPVLAEASCGDGFVTVGETCDDGDLFSGDGCDSSCQVEAQRVCFGEPSTCPVTQNDRVSLGGNHGCLLNGESDILCWGNNTHDQLLAPQGSNFKKVVSGYRHSCAQRSDNSLSCWGNDGSGRATPPLGAFADVQLGSEHSCALELPEDGGEIVCWGSNTSGKATPPAGSFVSMAIGHAHGCGIRSDQTIECWGSSLYGRTDAPTEGSFIQVAAGGRSSCAIRENQDAICWGADGDGQLEVPSGEKFSSIVVGDKHTCGLTLGGSIRCFGSANYQQNEDPEGLFVALAAGWQTNCSFRESGTAYCWGRNNNNIAEPPTGVMLPEVCGDNLLVGEEQCDDGNLLPGDGCRADCTEERCGDGILDEFEACESGINGFGACCNEDCSFLGSEVECRGPEGVCDLVEYCSGTGESCPVDAKSESSCRSAVGSCDVEEFCDGFSNDCPADTIELADSVCRGSQGNCDLAEVCSGNSGICPSDMKRTDTCRPAGGVCDVAEVCDGVANECPNDQKYGTETSCRPSAYDCDAEEFCDGAGDACSVDLESAAGDACSDDGIFCTEDRCDGAGACTHLPGRSGVQCRGSAGACDVAEVCDGANEACPEDSGLPDSDDDGTCDAQDLCPDIFDPDQIDSDGDGDGDFCDICTASGEAISPQVKISKLTTGGGDDKFLLKGFMVFDAPPVFDPRDNGIRVLVEDASGALVVDATIPGGAFSPVTRSGWIPLKNGGYRFRSKALIGSAIQKVILKRTGRDPNAIVFKVTGAKGSFAFPEMQLPLMATLTLDPDPEMAAVCAEMAFSDAKPGPYCSFRNGNSVVLCR